MWRIIPFILSPLVNAAFTGMPFFLHGKIYFQVDVQGHALHAPSVAYHQLFFFRHE
jgi:hypothetical protein